MTVQPPQMHNHGKMWTNGKDQYFWFDYGDDGDDDNMK